MPLIAPAILARVAFRFRHDSSSRAEKGAEKGVTLIFRHFLVVAEKSR
jgi:hypothetical protein